MLVECLILFFSLKFTNGLNVNDSCVMNHNGLPGICKINSECQIVNDMLKCKRIIPTTCGFDGLSSIVCCPTNKVNLEDCLTNRKSPMSEKISLKKCNEYKKCEKSRYTRQLPETTALEPPSIVGGYNAPVGEYPHMAAIGWSLINGDGHAWNCGGSLVSEYYVLTAGHCTYSKDDKINNTAPDMVKLGVNFLYDSDTQNIDIENIIKHPNYTGIRKYHDIALLRLKNAAILNEYVRPICLWQTENFPTNRTIATGWGNLGHMQSSSPFLQDVFINIIDSNICKNFYKTRRALPQGIINEQLCAGDMNGGKDTCQGDSGGPLQIADPDVSCGYHLIGVTSFGVGCGGANSPAVYTRVSSYIDWIESVVWPN